MRSAIIVLLAGSLFSPPVCGQEMSTGDTVEARSHYSLHDGTRFTGPVRRGQQLTVREVKDRMLLVDTGSFSGWIQTDAVRLSRQKPANGRAVSITVYFQITPEPGTRSVTLTTVIPCTRRDRQTVHRISFSHEPARKFSDGDNQYAVFELEQPVDPVEISYTVQATVYRFDLWTLIKNPPAVTLDRSSLKRWLQKERWLETESPEVRAAVSEIATGSNDVETSQNIVRFVQDTLFRFSYRPRSLGAAGVLRKKGGDCTEFSDLFVTLCRAKGIPARTCDGYLLSPGRFETRRHCWSEYYSPRYGWIAVAPIMIDARYCSFQQMRNEYVLLTQQRNDPALKGSVYYRSHSIGQAAEVKNRVTVHRQGTPK